jgi:hypothetical protein
VEPTGSRSQRLIRAGLHGGNSRCSKGS